METENLLAGKRAVVCEDEGLVRIALSKLLKRAGLNVVGVAADGEEAVAVVLRERPDMVLMDIDLPVLDGIEASRRILEEYSVCIILVTAYDDAEYKTAAQNLPIAGLVSKPVLADDLLPLIRAAWSGYQSVRKEP